MIAALMTVSAAVDLWKVPLIALGVATVIVMVLWIVYAIGQWRS